jgi:NAD(P)-dependent dehydrogenase (short-subunit alcohol dehydrogenase family)
VLARGGFHGAGHQGCAGHGRERRSSTLPRRRARPLSPLGGQGHGAVKEAGDGADGLTSFDPGGVAVVFGVSGGIGGALHSALAGAGRFRTVLGFSRRGAVPFELTDEASIARAAAAAAQAGTIRLAFDATGLLHEEGARPEKSWGELDAERLRHAFAVNAIGPALLMKHVLPLLPRAGKSVFATLSARVGSIGDNRLRGWYGYRASKAALNQLGGRRRSSWAGGRRRQFV